MPRIPTIETADDQVTISGDTGSTTMTVDGARILANRILEWFGELDDDEDDEDE